MAVAVAVAAVAVVAVVRRRARGEGRGARSEERGARGEGRGGARGEEGREARGEGRGARGEEGREARGERRGARSEERGGRPLRVPAYLGDERNYPSRPFPAQGASGHPLETAGVQRRDGDHGGISHDPVKPLGLGGIGRAAALSGAIVAVVG